MTTMNKTTKLQKLIGKPLILAIVTAVIILAGVIVAAFAGFNLSSTLESSNQLTVTMDSYTFSSKLEDIQATCEKQFESSGVDYNYSKQSEMNGYEAELVYVFDADVDLTAVKTALSTALTGVESVTVTKVDATGGIPTSYVVRAVVAGAVFCVLAFAYIAIRHKLSAALAVVLSMVAGAGLTFAVCALTRIPVTYSVTYSVFFAMIVTTVATMFHFFKIFAKSKTEEGKAMTAEQLTNSSLAVKEILIFAVTTAVALVLLGAIAQANVRWFAITALVALVCGIVSSLVIAPAAYIVFKTKSDKKAAERARYDYKKTKKDSVEPAKN